MGNVWARAGLALWMATGCVEPVVGDEPVLDPAQPYSLEVLPRCTVAELADTDSTSCGVLQPVSDGDARPTIDIDGVRWSETGGVLLREDRSGRVDAVAVVPRVWLGEHRGAVVLVAPDGRRWRIRARKR